MAMPTYEEMLYSIQDYYGSDSDVWLKIDNSGRTYQDIMSAYSQIPRMQQIFNDAGDTVAWTYADPINLQVSDINNPVFDFDSNLGGSSYGGDNVYDFDIPSNWTYDNTDYHTSTGLVDPQTGTGMMTVLDKVSLAKAGVSLGCKLGAAIDSALYDINPEWWDENFPTINPDTWPSLCSTEGGKKFMCSLFGIDSDAVAYFDERALAQAYQLLRDKGAFDDAGYNARYTGSTEYFPYPDITYLPIYRTCMAENQYYVTTFTSDPNCYMVFHSTGNYYLDYLGLSLTRGAEVTRDDFRKDSGTHTTSVVQCNSEYTTNNGTTFYVYNGSTSGFSSSQVDAELFPYSFLGNTIRQIGTIIFDGTITESGGLDGVTGGATGTTPDKSLITGTDLSTVLQQLKTNYPDLFTGAKTLTVPQEDGSLKTYNYIPVPFADTTTSPSEQDKDKIVTDDLTQTDTEVGQETFTRELLKTPTNDPPDTGEGSGPSVVVPTGEASSLWAVYHPSQSQLNSFGAWLWSSNFVDQLKKLFNDPMQAIIGVHKVFAPIPTGSSQNIKCGYLDSGVSSPTVSSQYTEVNCGSVYCGEYYGNVFDYDPFTKISIYLPFIGVVPLKTSEVMRSTVSVIYGVDVITGACLAKVKISRDGESGILYSYGGSCACHYPISSGSYGGIISGIVTSAIGIASGVATGNPLTAVGGIVAGARQAHTEVQHSGGFTGCAGAMGPKKPYLIVTRPQTRVADNVKDYFGIPSNSTQQLINCSGFVRVKEVHFTSTSAYNDEAQEIETLLKNGIII